MSNTSVTTRSTSPFTFTSITTPPPSFKTKTTSSTSTATPDSTKYSLPVMGLFLMSLSAFFINVITLDDLKEAKSANKDMFTVCKVIGDILGCIFISSLVSFLKNLFGDGSKHTTQVPLKEQILLTCGLMAPLLLDAIALFGFMDFSTFIILKCCKVLVATVVKIYNSGKVKKADKLEAFLITIGAYLFFVGMPKKPSSESWKMYLGAVFLVISLVISGITNQRIGEHLKKTGVDSSKLLLKLSCIQLFVIMFIIFGVVCRVHLIYKMNTTDTIQQFSNMLPNLSSDNLHTFKLFLISSMTSAIVRQCAMETTRIFDTVFTAMFAICRKCGILATIMFLHGGSFTVYQITSVGFFVAPIMSRIFGVIKKRCQTCHEDKVILLPL